MTERTDDDGEEPYDAAERRAGAAHAAALKAAAGAAGLRFEAYLPVKLALWLLDLIETGVFRDPAEAVFVLPGDQKDLAADPDLRRELLRRTIEAGEDDPRPPMPLDEVMDELDALITAPRLPAAVWNSSVTRIGVTDPAGSPIR